MQNIDEILDQAIKARDMESIRRALNTWILPDPGFTKGFFDERLRYCRDQGISEADLFVPFTGDPLNEDPAAWTDRYFASAKTAFNSNFSRERLTHLRKVGAKVFPSASASSTERAKNQEAKPQTQTSGIPGNRASPAPDSSKEESKKKSGHEIPVSDRRTSEKNGRFPWWLVPIGIGAAVLLFLLSRKR